MYNCSTLYVYVEVTSIDDWYSRSVTMYIYVRENADYCMDLYSEYFEP